jgi:hypothetical protein
LAEPPATAGQAFAAAAAAPNAGSSGQRAPSWADISLQAAGVLLLLLVLLLLPPKYETAGLLLLT